MISCLVPSHHFNRFSSSQTTSIANGTWLGSTAHPPRTPATTRMTLHVTCLMANPKPTFCDWHRARNGGIPNMTHDAKHPLLDVKPWIHSTQGRVFRSNKGVKSRPFWLTNWAMWNKPERADMNYEWNWHPDWWKGKWRDPFNGSITIILWNHNIRSIKSLDSTG